jgi:exonuclease VII large subunit
VNYKKILARGFALVKDKNGKLITSASQTQPNDSLTITLAKGEIKVITQ